MSEDNNNNNNNNVVLLFLIDICSQEQQLIQLPTQDIVEVKIKDLIVTYSYNRLINDLNVSLEYSISSAVSTQFKSQCFQLQSLLFQSIYNQQKDNFEFNTFISNVYTSTLLSTLLSPIINFNIISFLQIYQIILNCKIKSFNILTIETINEITFFYRSLKVIITKNLKIINKNTNILKLISNIILEINKNSIKYLINNEQLLTKQISMLFVKVIIDDLSTLSITDGKVYPQYDEIVENYCNVIKLFWNDNQLSSIQTTMEHMFKKLISSKGNNDTDVESSITPTISNVLNISPIELIPLFINIIDNGNVPDSDLLETISKLTGWPLTTTNSKWILETFNSLIKSKKTTLLASIVVECSLQVIKQMFQFQLLLPSFEILQKMLLGYQHSPDTFHSIIHIFPIIIELLLKYNNNLNGTIQQPLDQSSVILENSKNEFINLTTQTTVYKLINQCNNRKDLLLISVKNAYQPSRFKNTIKFVLDRFCILSYTLMFHHTGYPELYTPLVEALNKCNHIVPPLEFEIKKLLKENEWVSLDSMVFENIKLNRLLTDRSGLVNLGNTCYMNSFIQSLYMTIPFRKYLIYTIDQLLIESITKSNTQLSQDEVYKLYSNQILKRPQLLKQFQMLFGLQLLSIKESISPNLFLQSLPIEYQTGQQHDSFEFGKSLLDNLDLIFKQQLKCSDSVINNTTTTTATTTPLKTEISNLFGGKLSQITICRTCKTRSVKREEFLELSLSFHDSKKSNYQLEEMVNVYLSSEEMIGENKYHCEKCNSLQDADKIIEINETPSHLIIGLNRFHFSRESKSIEKLLNHVDYPLHLNLPWIDQDTVQIKEEKQEGKQEKQVGEKKKKEIIKLSNYSLYSVIIHSGRSHGHGHYYNYSRSSNTGVNGKDWCLFNDSMVKITDVSSFKNITKQFYTDVPYILFYVKNETDGDNQQSNVVENTSSNDILVSPWIKHQILKENQNLVNKFNSKDRNSNLLEQFHVYGQFKK